MAHVQELAAPFSLAFECDQYGKPKIDCEPERIYAFGRLIREAEQALLRLFSEGLLSGTTHTCIGQEICQMAVVRVLNHPDDIILSNHRNHGHFLTYSGDFTGLLAEIMGREGGVCGGIGGSQHLHFRHFHSNGVQGGMAAIAVGHGLAVRMAGAGAIVAVILGDGTLGEGLVYEALNLASAWSVPVLFVVENNRIAQTTPTAQTLAGDIRLRGEAFGLSVWRLDDAQPDFLHAVEDVVRQVRDSRRPAFLVIDTERMGPHSKGDDLRDPGDIALIQARDPLARIGELLPAVLRVEIENAAREYIEAARDSAAAMRPAHALENQKSLFVFPPGPLFREPVISKAGQSTRASINSALEQLLVTHPEVILLGEDLHDPYGGAFKVTAGLSTRFPDRVLSTPISEAAIVGAGIGLALAGYRPIVEIMFADFVTLAMDQIVNHAVKFPGMFPGTSIPLVIRMPSGGRRGYGPTHSQSPEGLLCGIPGLTVVFPSARHDPGTLLANAVLRWPYPTVFVEHKLLYGEPVSAGEYRVADPDPLDSAAALFPTLVGGSTNPDITFVAYGSMVQMAEAAAARLAAEELDVEIIVPSLLVPFSTRTLCRLLSGRDRVLVLEECPSAVGFAAELGARLLESGYQGKFARVGAAPVPIPAARSLEELVLPDQGRISEAVLELLDLA